MAGEHSVLRQFSRGTTVKRVDVFTIYISVAKSVGKHVLQAGAAGLLGVDEYPGLLLVRVASGGGCWKPQGRKFIPYLR